jgi:hypothetical protein
MKPALSLFCLLLVGSDNDGDTLMQQLHRNSASDSEIEFSRRRTARCKALLAKKVYQLTQNAIRYLIEEFEVRLKRGGEPLRLPG